MARDFGHHAYPSHRDSTQTARKMIERRQMLNEKQLVDFLYYLLWLALQPMSTACTSLPTIIVLGHEYVKVVDLIRSAP